MRIPALCVEAILNYSRPAATSPKNAMYVTATHLHPRGRIMVTGCEKEIWIHKSPTITRGAAAINMQRGTLCVVRARANPPASLMHGWHAVQGVAAI